MSEKIDEESGTKLQKLMGQSLAKALGSVD